MRNINSYSLKNKHIYEAVSKIIKPHFKDYEEFFLLLVENWYSIVPQNWQSNVLPLKFKWLTNHKAILYVKPNNNSVVINLNFESPIVIKQINSFFGKNVITKIVYKI